MRSLEKYATANARWAGLGPYYAMFPSVFSDQVIAKYSKPGDTVLDPFAGRGTALFSAASAARRTIGIEVNPVGWVYCKTKLDPAPKHDVLARIEEIEFCAPEYRDAADELPVFFHHCFCERVRTFLVCARALLDWRNKSVDRTIMAFLLTHLHGKSTDALSNQMRQTKAMAPQYAIEWWQERGLTPPPILPVPFLQKKLNWRYAKGIPKSPNHVVLLGDSASLVPDLRGGLGKKGLTRPSLLLTSPPYLGITNYHYDQWIRLWLLGGPPTDRRTASQFRGKHQGKFENLQVYKSLLSTVFGSSAKILRNEAVVYVRTDRREPTVSITRDVLKTAFPMHKIRRLNQPLAGHTQTRLFGHRAPRVGEVDFVLTPK